MCEITNTRKIGNETIIDCSPYSGEFINAKLLTIIDSQKRTYKTSNFKLDKTRPCFSKGGSPWIMTSENIPENFLSKGNEILFQ